MKKKTFSILRKGFNINLPSFKVEVFEDGSVELREDPQEYDGQWLSLEKDEALELKKILETIKE